MSEKSTQSSPQLQPSANSSQSSPQIITQQTPTNVNQPLNASATQSPNIQPQLAQKPPQQPPVANRTPSIAQQTPKNIAPQQPQTQTNTNTTGAASSMTLLDNLTSQLTPERKERFIELFRQLQNDNVTANQFLAQARMLLDQRQYQQLENLKSKPAVQPPAKAAIPRSPIQPQNVNQPMNSSQVRAEDAQRSMSGLLAPHPKRLRATDNTSQPLPLYRSNSTPMNQQILQQQLKQGQQQQQANAQPFQSQQSFIPQQPNTHAQTTENSPAPAKTDNNDGQGLAQDIMNPELLTKRIQQLVEPMNLKVGQDVETLIALSVEKRLQHLLHEMISASKFRVDSQSFTQPPIDETGHHPFKIVDIQDIKKQLLAVERVEREEERKRKEQLIEKERRAQMGEDGGEGVDDDSRPSKKKKKKEMGPGVTARYMSDDVRNKSTNETALLIAGGVKKSWMYATTPSKDKAPPLSVSRQNSTSLHDAISPTTNISTSPGGAFLSTSPTNAAYASFDTQNDDQPRGRGRPRRRKSGSGQDALLGKKPKGFGRGAPEAGLFLPPSTIGRPHRLGEQSSRKVTIRDALFVLEDESENRPETAPRTLLKAYSVFLK